MAGQPSLSAHHGSFQQDIGYISTNDPYSKRSRVSDRNRGVQFKVSGPKKGMDAMFEKEYKSVSTGDKYTDPGTVDKKEREANRKKLITPSGFAYSNPKFSKAGPEGTFNTFEHIDEEGGKPKKRKSAEEKKGLKNITSSPGKKGTFGVPGTLLGKVEFLDSKEGALPERKQKKEKDPSKKFVGGGPFKATCKSVEYFDGQPNVPASKIYTIETGKLPHVRKPPAAAAQKAISEVPFKPGGLTRADASVNDVFKDEGLPKATGRKQHKKEEKAMVVWKPVSGYHSGPTKSIITDSTVVNIGVARGR